MDNLLRSNIIRRISGIIAGIFPLLVLTASAFGAVGPWWSTDHGRVRLVAASSTAGTSETIRLGLQFEMAPGWKIYWRSPGDAGFPPRPNWAGSKNLAGMDIEWPLPERFSVLGLETLGYKKEVVLPLTATLFEPGKQVQVRARVPYLTCAEICVPYEANLVLDLPAGAETETPEAGLIDRFANLVPKKGADKSLSVATAEVDGKPGAQMLRIVAHAADSFKNPDLLIEGPPGFLFGKPRIDRVEEGVRAIMLAAVTPPRSGKNDQAPSDLVGASLTLTMIDGTRAIEQRIQARKGRSFLPPPAAPPVSVMAFIGLLGLAVIGGLILNLMPCVLPVLSLKLLSVIGHGGADHGQEPVGRYRRGRWQARRTDAPHRRARCGQF